MRSDLVWSGRASLVWSGLVWFCLFCLVSALVCVFLSGLLCSGMGWCGLVWGWCGLVWCALLWCGLLCPGYVNGAAHQENGAAATTCPLGTQPPRLSSWTPTGPEPVHAAPMVPTDASLRYCLAQEWTARGAGIQRTVGTHGMRRQIRLHCNLAVLCIDPRMIQHCENVAPHGTGSSYSGRSASSRSLMCLCSVFPTL